MSKKLKPDNPDRNPFEPEEKEVKTETTIKVNESWVNITEKTHNADGSISQSADNFPNKTKNDKRDGEKYPIDAFSDDPDYYLY